MTSGDSAPSFTVADALELPVLREGVPEVLSGHEQLDHSIRWVHSGEFPDMPSVLKGGELLLTHGMTIPSTGARRRRYVADLARAAIAALVIELGSGVREVPREIVDEARRHDLPLVALHRPIPWVEVTETIHARLLGQRDALLAHGQELHDRFLALLVGGAGGAEILHAVAETVGNPVVLSHGDERVYSATLDLGETTVASGWDAHARGLASAPETAGVPVSVDGDPEWGRVSILALRGPLAPADRIALTRAAPIIALAFMRAYESETLAARDRGDFLDALIDPTEPLAEHHAHGRAAALGFTTRSSWLLPIAAELAVGFGRLDERRWALVGRDLREELGSRQTPAVVGMLRRSQHLAVVAGLSSPEHRPSIARAVADAAQRAVRRAGSDALIVVCVGRPVASWREAREALRETVDAVPSMRQAPHEPWHDVSGPDLHRLLWSLGRHPAMAEFSTRSLEPLVAYDTRRGSHLLETLVAYCAAGGRKAEAARSLHLERQSLYKRLAKIQALLNVDLENQDTLLGLQLAVKVRPLLPTLRP